MIVQRPGGPLMVAQLDESNSNIGIHLVATVHLRGIYG
jgi:hypothetical protein